MPAGRKIRGALYEVPASYNAPFSCVCGAFTDDFWAYPAAEEFAEWLRGNLCIPDQEYVDSLISL